MFQKRKLKNYVKRALKKGKTKEQVTKLLTEAGWKKEELEDVFDSIEKKEIEITLPFKKKVEEPKEEPKEEVKEKKPVGMKQQLDDISETLEVITQKKKSEKKLKKKNFKLPLGMKGKLKKLAVKNKVQVMLLQRTRNIMPTIGEIRDGMLMVGDNVYEGAVKYTWLWRGKFPTMIVPEWDLSPLNKEGIDNIKQPIGAEEIYKDTKKNYRSAEPQKIIIRAIEAKENQMLKKPVNVKVIVITIIITLIIAAILFGGKVV